MNNSMADWTFNPCFIYPCCLYKHHARMGNSRKGEILLMRCIRLAIAVLPHKYGAPRYTVLRAVSPPVLEKARRHKKTAPEGAVLVS
ncbi:hypothetical protein [Janthinobacterium violaceinigrum]|uniref:Uncharacterized protein n=1 Tax=Janthinobacterium violaceinigrum TaxID=2654252 RepID=A0A6I1IB58_9BURK|nr:hypothetical protein [Janthinobacterium violaceinigrum]KAB8065596.1 hypothetical protein GCN75_07415 [Janthinobacterium violaceinigrum]